MKLNLQIICHELGRERFETCYAHDATTFDCAYPLPYTASGQIKPEVVYVVRAEDLPAYPAAQRPSLICIGMPPDIYLDSDASIIWTQEEIDVISLLAEVSAVFARCDAWAESMQEVLDDEEPIRLIGELAQPFIENPIIFGKPGFRCIFHVASVLEERSPEKFRAYCKDFDTEGMTMEEDAYPTLETINEMISDPEYQRSMNADVPTIYSGVKFGYQSLFLNIGTGGSYVARITIDGVQRDFDEADFGLIKIIARYLEKGIRGKDVESFNRPKDLDEILGDLLAHRLIPEQRIATVLEGYRWRVDDEYFCMVMESTSFSRQSSVLKASAAQVALRLPSECYTIFDDRLVFVFDLTRIRMEQKDVLERAIPLFRDSFLTAGISTSFFDFKNLYYFHQQAVAALTLGKRRDPMFWYFRYDNYLLDDLIARVKGNRISEALYPTGLRKLIAYDAERGCDLVPLLRVYLETGMNEAETVRATYMHRNTCDYRLKRIREIGGFDFADPDTRLSLEIAFKIMG